MLSVSAQSFAGCSGDPHGTMVVKTPSSFLFLRVVPLASASAGATPPLYGTVRRPLGWNSSVCAGYDVDFFLLCSPHPRCFDALFSPFFGAIGPFWRLPDAMEITDCANYLLNYNFFFLAHHIILLERAFYS